MTHTREARCEILWTDHVFRITNLTSQSVSLVIISRKKKEEKQEGEEECYLVVS